MHSKSKKICQKFKKISTSQFESLNSLKLKRRNFKRKIIIVEDYFSSDLLNFIESKIQILNQDDPTWMALYDNCVDYHRINDEYAKSLSKLKLIHSCSIFIKT